MDQQQQQGDGQQDPAPDIDMCFLALHPDSPGRRVRPCQGWRHGLLSLEICTPHAKLPLSFLSF
jgi:hypothetical protein